MNICRIALLAVTGMTGLAVTTAASATDPAWLRKISQLVAANNSYPRSAQLRGEQGSAKVKIAFSGAGKVLSVALVESSGSAILDREAVRVPMKVGTYPAPPTGGNTNIVLPITWRIAAE